MMSFLAKNSIKSVLSLGVFLLLLIPIFTFAQLNPQINYQGKLTDSNGVAVPDGLYNMNFWLLTSDVAATSTAIWSESLTSGNRVQVQNGLFSVMLGEQASLEGVNFNQTLYLGVEIGGLSTTTPVWDGEMSPRKVLGTVPTAFFASTTNSFGGLATTSFIRSDIDDTASGLLTFTGGLISTASSTINNLTTDIATTTTFVINNQAFTNLLGNGLTNESGVLTVSTSSLTGLNAETLNNQTGTYYLDRANHTGTQLASTISDFSTTARALLSSTATGLTYTSGTGVFSLTAGYNIPLTASTTEWANKVSSQWTTSGSNIYYNTGNVGIGTSTPGATLDLGFGSLSLFGGIKTDSDIQNTFLGTNTGTSTTGTRNTFVGAYAGASNTTGGENDFFGRLAGTNNTIGTNNTFLGNAAGYYTVNGSNNVAVGRWAGYNNTGGGENVFLGGSTLAGGSQATSTQQVLIGHNAGYSLGASTGNVLIGYAAGDNLTSGNRNIILGYDLNAPSSTASYQLNIGNLIFGTNLDGTNNTLSNGNIGIGTTNPGAKLEVVGDIISKGTEWTSRNSTTTNAWLSVTYGNGTFVAVSLDGTGNRVMTSPDGVNWTPRTSAADNIWRSVTYGNGLFVAVSSDGTGNRVMTSPDGITWTSRTSAADNNWYSVTYGNNLFVAVSVNGTGNRVMTSPDGITWTTRTSAADNQWLNVTYGNGLFVAVAQTGTGNRVMTSPDGITWIPRTSAADNNWQSVTYGNGLFVAVANSGTGNRVMTSPDGITWTSRTSAANNGWSSVTYGNGLFVAVSNTGTGNRVMTSPDGITWTTRTSAADNIWHSVTYGNGLFVAVSSDGTGNRVMTSGKPDTSSFAHNNIYQGNLSIFNSLNIGTSTNSSNLFRIATSTGTELLTFTQNGRLGIGTTTPSHSLTVAGDTNITGALRSNGNAGTAGQVLQSTGTGFQWVATSSLGIGGSSLSGGTNGFLARWTSASTLSTGLFLDNGTVAGINATTSTSTFLVRGTAGINPFTVASSTGNPLFTIAQNGNVGIGTTNPGAKLEVVGDIISKGTEWTIRTSAANHNWTEVAYGNGLFVAVAQSGTGNRVMVSPDGTTWKSASSSVDNAWRAVTYGNGLFVAVAQTGTGNRVMTSPDGINWTTRASAEDNSWFDVTYGNGTFVAVSANGTNRVMTSPDGITWTSRSAAASQSWNSVTYGNGLFVAVSTGLTLSNTMTSPDGITWTLRTSSAANSWESVTYGNGIFVAVADSGTGNRVMTSPDGITWATSTSASDNNWQSVTYGNGLFVAVANSGTGDRVMTSPDGITWTLRTSAADNSWNGITYGNGVFVAVSDDGGSARVMTSGKTDTSAFAHNNLYQGGMNIMGNVGIGTTTPSAALDIVGNSVIARGTASTSVAYSGLYTHDGLQSLFLQKRGQGSTGSVSGLGGAELVSVGTSSLAILTYIDGGDLILGANNTERFRISSTTGNVGIGASNPGAKLEVVGDIISKGTEWTSRTSAADNEWRSVTYGNGLFVAVSETGSSNRVMTSPDGINWTSRTNSVNNVWRSVTYGNGLFVAVASSGTGDRVMTSPDGINWTTRTTPVDNNWYSVTYGNGLFVAVASSGTGDRVMTSPDGINWTIRTSAADNSWVSVTYGNGLFVAVAISGTNNRVMTSPDGINWTIRTTPADNGWNSVTYGNGLFVAVSYTGTGNRVMTSPDGTTWTLRTTSVDNSWVHVTYGNGLFVAFAASGTGNRVMTSPDGINWTARTSVADTSWRGAVYGNGIFVAVSDEGSGNRVMTSGKTETSALAHNNIYQGNLSIFNSLNIGTSTNSNNFFRIATSTGAELLTFTQTGQLGIGTTSPLFALHVRDSGSNTQAMFESTGAASNIRFRDSATTNDTYLGSVANSLRFGHVSGGDRLTIDSTGNVGIGTTTPAQLLTVAGSARITGAFFDSNNASGTAGMVLQTTGNGTQWVATSSLGIGGGGSLSGGVNGYVARWTGSSALSTGLLLDDGTVAGINATSTLNTFWVQGSPGKNPFAVASSTGSPLLTVDQNGYVGIGSTAPSAKLEIVGDIVSKGTEWTARSGGVAPNHWYDVAYGNGLFVAVAIDGTSRVMTSPDGVTWTARTAAAANLWSSVTYGNGMFVAVAYSGTGDRVMTSPDGINWTSRTSAADNNWFSVTYGNGLFVAVSNTGTGNRVMTSPDGINWTSRTSATDNNWYDVTYGNGLFVAVANSGTGNRVMTSPDGITWTSQTSAADNNWRAVTYGNGQFVAVALNGASSEVMTSSNGTSWTSQDIAVPNDSWEEIVYGNGLFVAVGGASGGDVVTSPDGINWTLRSTPASGSGGWYGVAYGNGTFVGVGSNVTARVMTSGKQETSALAHNNIYQGGMTINGDVVIGTSTATSSSLQVFGDLTTTNLISSNVYNKGIEWTSRTSAADNEWYGVTYGNGRFVAVSANGTGDRVMTSPDGINWATSTGPVENNWRAVTYGNGLFVAISTTGTGNRVMTSPDGITWTSRSTPADNAWRAITYGNGLFVAVASTGTGNRVMTSPDGITWTLRTSAADNGWYGVTYGNGLFVAVSDTGTGNRVMTSPDGITWTSRTSAADNGWYSVVYGNGIFVAVSTSGTVMTSPDGITWTLRTSAVANTWRAVTYGNGLFVAVATTGSGDRIMTSPDGITWTARTSPAENFWRSIVYGNGMFVAVSYSGTGNRVMTSGKNDYSSFAHNNIYQGNLSIFNSLNIGTSTNSSNLFRVATSTGAELLTFTQTGQLGIGSSTPTQLLTVAGTSSLRTILPETNLAYNLGSSAQRFNEGWISTLNIGTSTWSMTQSANGRFSLFDAASGGGTERFTILSNGNVGIGSTTPSEALTVSGNIRSNNLYTTANRTYLGNLAGDGSTGNNNTFIGAGAGEDSTGGNVTAIGYDAGNGGSEAARTLIGYQAGLLAGGQNVIAIGDTTGVQSDSDYGILIGWQAGAYTAATEVTAIGAGAGYNTGGDYLIAIGGNAGYDNDGADVIALGGAAGRNNSGDNGIFIGYEAGRNNTLDNKFILKQNHLNTTPLLYGDFTTGYLGVGTTTSGYALTVQGDTNITGALRSNGNAGTSGQVLQSTGTGFQWVATSSLGIGGSSPWTTSGSDIYYNTGNVGIGTSTPSELFTVGSANPFQVTSSGQVRGINGTASAPTFSFVSDTNTGIYRDLADTLRFAAGGVARATVNSSGLTVTGSLTVADNTTQLIGNGGSASIPTFTFSGDTNTGIYRPDFDTLGFTTNSNDRMRINSSGNVGIGTGSGILGERLEVVGNIISKGTAWTSRTSAVSNSWYSVAYGNGMFVAVSTSGTGNRVMTSPDGINWTSRTSAANNNWSSVTYGNGMFVAVSTSGTGNRVMTSPDGINWTSRTSAADLFWSSVTYGNGMFVAVAYTGTGNRVMTSPDGINWTSRTSAADNSWYSVTYGNGLFVAVSTSGTDDRVMTSPDGITWTSQTSAADNNWASVTYGNGLFVAVAWTGSGDRVMTSPDGINWSTQSSAADNQWTAVTYGNGLFVATAFSGSGNRVMTSPDGINWTTRSSTADNTWYGLTYGNGMFVAVAAEGAVMTSGKPDTSAFAHNNIYQGGMNILGGNVGIGTTTPQRALHVQIAVDAPPVRFQDSNGYCEINPTSTTWTCTSDERLKENIETLSSAEILGGIKALRSVNFSWISDDNHAIRTGFIAQEVEAIFPDLVSTDPETGYKSVGYGGFTPYLVASIQEIDAILGSPTATSTTPESFSTSIIFEKILAAFEYIGVKIKDSVLTIAGVKTDELCVGDVCVDEAMFLQMVEQSGSTPTEPDNSGGEEVETPTEPEPTPIEDNTGTTTDPTSEEPTEETTTETETPTEEEVEEETEPEPTPEPEETVEEETEPEPTPEPEETVEEPSS